MAARAEIDDPALHCGTDTGESGVWTLSCHLGFRLDVAMRSGAADDIGEEPGDATISVYLPTLQQSLDRQMAIRKGPRGAVGAMRKAPAAVRQRGTFAGCMRATCCESGGVATVPATQGRDPKCAPPPQR